MPRKRNSCVQRNRVFPCDHTQGSTLKKAPSSDIMNMDEDEYEGRLVIDERETKEIRTAETYRQSRNWNPIASSCPTLVNLLSTPSKTTATTLQTQQCDIKPTVPTKPLLRSSSHNLQLGRMSPVSPQCYGCMALTCICSTKDQEEY